MLSHPVSPTPEAESVATAPSKLLETAPNRRRHSITVREFFSQFDRAYFRDWFITGPKLILKGGFSHRAAGFMIAAATPAILAALFITIPGLLFHTPEHNAYFHFAKIVEGDSVLPVILGTISSIFSFRFPLG
jgi:hypothetical protein